MAFGTLKVNRVEGYGGLALDLSGTTDIAFGADLNPDADSTRDLGTDLVRWKDIYADNVYADDVYILPPGATARISTGQARLAIEGNSANFAHASLIQNGSVSILELGRGGDNAIGSVVAVSNQQDLGVFRFAGTDGANLVGAAGLIATAEATWTTSARPASLSFATRGANEDGPKAKLSISPTGSTLVGSATFGGNSPLESVGLRVSRNISTHGVPAATFGYGIVSDGKIQTDLGTSNGTERTATMFSANPSTAASGTAYTVSTLVFYDALQENPLGANSTVTALSAFRAGNNLDKASTNVGFRSEVPSSVANNRSFLSTSSAAASQFNSETYMAAVATKRVYTGGQSSSVTLATGLIFGAGYVSGAPSADITYTLPTGEACDDNFQQLPNDYGSEWTVINLSAGNTITIAANPNGHSAAGDLVVAAGTSARFLTYKTATDSFQTARIA